MERLDQLVKEDEVGEQIGLAVTELLDDKTLFNDEVGEQIGLAAEKIVGSDLDLAITTLIMENAKEAKSLPDNDIDKVYYLYLKKVLYNTGFFANNNDLQAAEENIALYHSLKKLKSLKGLSQNNFRTLELIVDSSSWSTFARRSLSADFSERIEAVEGISKKKSPKKSELN